MTAVERLAHFAVSAPYHELSDTAREQLKIGILDALGCGIGVLESTPTRIIRKDIDEFDAGFPTGLEWTFVPKDAPHPRYLVANADEMEPGTFKDRLLLDANPHQLIEGMILAGYATGMDVAYIFLRGEYKLAARRIARAIAEAVEHGFGYLLVAFQSSGNLAATSVAFYLVAYFVTMLGAFGVVAILSDSTRDADLIDNYPGLFWRRPAVAAIFTAMLFSLAGIPITAGFIGKFRVVAAGAPAAMWSLAIVLVITTAIGLFYYLRIVVAVYGEAAQVKAGPTLAVLGTLALIFVSASLVFLGVFPQPLLALIRNLTAGRT